MGNYFARLIFICTRSPLNIDLFITGCRSSNLEFCTSKFVSIDVLFADNNIMLGILIGHCYRCIIGFFTIYSNLSGFIYCKGNIASLYILTTFRSCLLMQCVCAWLQAKGFILSLFGGPFFHYFAIFVKDLEFCSLDLIAIDILFANGYIMIINSVGIFKCHSCCFIFINCSTFYLTAGLIITSIYRISYACGITINSIGRLFYCIVANFHLVQSQSIHTIFIGEIFKSIICLCSRRTGYFKGKSAFYFFIGNITFNSLGDYQITFFHFRIRDKIVKAAL